MNCFCGCLWEEMMQALGGNSQKIPWEGGRLNRQICLQEDIFIKGKLEYIYSFNYCYLSHLTMLSYTI